MFWQWKSHKRWTLWAVPSSCPMSDQRQLQLLQKGYTISQIWATSDIVFNSVTEDLRKENTAAQQQLGERSNNMYRRSSECTKVSAGGGQETVQAGSRHSLQPRIGPCWSRLCPCSLWALYRAVVHLMSLQCSSGYSLKESTAHGESL